MDIPESKFLLRARDYLTPELGEDIKSIFEDKGMKEAFEKRSTFNLLDSAEYFLSQVTTIASPKYQPTHQDILRSRQKTVGIQEIDFMIETYKFKLVDVGKLYLTQN